MAWDCFYRMRGQIRTSEPRKPVITRNFQRPKGSVLTELHRIKIRASSFQASDSLMQDNLVHRSVGHTFEFTSLTGCRSLLWATEDVRLYDNSGRKPDSDHREIPTEF